VKKIQQHSQGLGYTKPPYNALRNRVIWLGQSALTRTTILEAHRVAGNREIRRFGGSREAAAGSLLGALSNYGPAVRRYSEGKVKANSNTVTGDIMTKYLVAIYHPDDYDPSVESKAMLEEIHALNREMIAAGARIFAGGLSSAKSAKSLRAHRGGNVQVTDGPYTETKEHIGGFWVLEAANLDEALAWGRKAAVACRAPVEVRQVN